MADKFADINLSIYNDNIHFADESAIAHIEPINLSLDLSKIDGIEKFSWCFSDQKTKQALLTISPGYTLGGGKESSRNPRNIDNPSREQPSHDCSSFIADICGIKNTAKFSTVDQYLTYQIAKANPAFNNNKSFNEEIKKIYAN